MSFAKASESKMGAQVLTRHPLGSFKELMTLSWPLALSLLFTCLMSICDRFFLARYSLEALEACGSVTYLVSLFQIPCIRIASISQVYVGQYKGAQSFSNIGEVVWQMIWFSLLSMFLTVPLSFCAANYFFSDTTIRELGTPYFFILMCVNFLFPLGAALSTFFTGQGRAATVTWVMAISLVLHIGLDFILIFGAFNIVPLKGIVGAAYATILSQAFYCLTLLALFMRKKERQVYGTNLYRLKWPLLKDCISLGFPRAISKLSVLAAWTAAVKSLTVLGGDYLMVLSIIGSLCTFFSCSSEGMGQGLITIISYLIGGEKKDRILLAVKSACFLLLGILGLLAIFPLKYPEKLILTFFSDAFSPEQLHTLVLSCYGLWAFFLWEGLSWIGLSILTAFGDTKFLMLYNAATSWCFTFLPIYLVLGVMKCDPIALWWLMTIPCTVSVVAYLLRIRKKFHLYSKLLA